MKHVIRLPFAVLLMALVSACAAPATVGNMTASLPDARSKAQASPFYENIAVGAVSGGEETNPLWTSEVNNSGFRQALEFSLADTFGTPGSAPKYTVSANLQGLDQPIAGLSLTVKSFAQYEVVDNVRKVAVFDENITASYTAQFGDAFLGVERLRLANEGSIRANIAAFLRKLLETKLEEPEETDESETSTDLSS